jgi:hypothetical protein
MKLCLFGLCIQTYTLVWLNSVFLDACFIISFILFWLVRETKYALTPVERIHSQECLKNNMINGSIGTVIGGTKLHIRFADKNIPDSMHDWLLKSWIYFKLIFSIMFIGFCILFSRNLLFFFALWKQQTTFSGG